MEWIEHKTISANGLNIHIAQKGEGPVILFIHGLAELWYSWRHQILFLADHGYRAVAPDLRGYGDTTGAPVNDPTKFTVLHLVGGMIGVVDAAAKEGERVFVVGHDWGAIIAWHLCLFRPEREWGDIEAELGKMSPQTVMKKFLACRDPNQIYFPKGKGFGHSLGDTPVILPPWLSEEDFEYFASKLEKTGITGAVNYYRAFHLSWELTAPWHGAKAMVPSANNVHHRRPALDDYINGDGYVPLLEEVVVMAGVAHFINQEKSDEVNKHIIEFFINFNFNFLL